MNKNATVIILLCAALLAAYLWFFADPNVVDEDYISSDSFKKLEQNIDYERDSVADRETVIRDVVNQMIQNQSLIQKKLPFRLDSLALDSVLNPQNRLSIPGVRSMPSGSGEYHFYGLIILEGENYRALLSLVELPGIYRDLEVGLTTVIDGQIVDKALIGRYEKNLTEKTYTEIYINENHEIRVEVDKQRFYPFEQEKRVSYRYVINRDGNIESSIL